MKTLLLNPIYFDPFIFPPISLYPPVNLVYLASSLKSIGESVLIVDTNTEHNCIDKIKQFNPDVVGIPMMSFSEPLVIDLAKKIKKITSAKILIGGPHVCIMQEAILKTHPEIDFGIYGEGEKAIQEFCKAIGGKAGFESVKGLIYREGGMVKKNKPREFNRNLDELPFPAWDLLDCRRYKFLPIIDSRGCPYQCNYCCVKDIQGRLWRPRSWENLIEEIQWNIKEYGFRRFYIDGDNLLIDKKRVIRLCKEMQKRKLQIEWVATQGLRADLVTDEVLSAMKAAGCEAVGFGIESGDDKVLKSMRKGETTRDIVNAVKLAKDKGFYVTGCFMVGNVGDSMDSVKKSIAFMKSLKLNAVYINLVVPYPKTELWNWVEKYGISFNKDMLYFPPALQEGKIKPAFETEDFPREERIEAYELFRKAAFWAVVKANLFKHSLLRIMFEKLMHTFVRAVCRFKNKSMRESILEKCDLWRERNL